ncbi:Chromatin assembly factor 1 subunit B [Boothiomyces macroporosus]|uniref:Chromatin assembly factor 1 subunit B n=1 Tax=Boothiomyces macroporosus TaxID=261099 RepID=A0AAD5Y960_9FUNG|nr:Chromatin assembly factor 1 subunit B [Boothiomyces macroporosus]
MRAKTLQIIWHDKLPIFSVDFDPIRNRFATCGGDHNARIWSLKDGNVEYLSTLSRHSAAVNCVRWSPNGQYIATGGDDGSILLWEQTDKKQQSLDDDEFENLEHWRTAIILRGTTSDLYDLAWSPNGTMIASAGIDSSIRVFDIKEQKCVHVLTEHQHFVQGVAWDPLFQYIASQSSDRALHVYKYEEKQKNSPKLLEEKTRMYMDEDLNSFFRRLAFSPDGQLLISTGGTHNQAMTAYVFTRPFNNPCAHLSNHQKAVIAVKFNPLKYKLRSKEKSFASTDYRYIYALATHDSVAIYDTEDMAPIAFFGKFHYASLTDISWSYDGQYLMISSIDGFCSMIEFPDNELGEIIVEEKIVEQVQVVAKPAKPETPKAAADGKKRITPILIR